MIKLLAFSGSTRRDSFNKKILKIAVSAAETTGAEITLLDLKNYPLPFYNGDLEQEKGLPENAIKLKEIIKKQDGFLIASPEYNSAFSGILKNTIDWASRPNPAEKKSENVFAGNKFAAIMSASPGPSGGSRGLVSLRMLLQNIGINLLADQCCIGSVHNAFDGEKLRDKKNQQAIESLAEKLVDIITNLKGLKVL